MKRVDISGQRFGMWTVVRYSRTTGYGSAMWLCRCDCGTEKDVSGTNIRFGLSKGCGCNRAEQTIKNNSTHKKSKSRVYRIWSGMIQRCTNPSRSSYVHYGERGIGVCEDWMRFENFFNDMGDPPDGLTLERVNNDLGYSKGNCIWADKTTQSRNSRNTKLSVDKVAAIKSMSVSTTAESMARQFGVSPSLIRAIKKGEVWADVNPDQTRHA